MSEAGKWSLIGGFLSRDETIEQGLKREILEESGWQVDNLRLLHIKDKPDRPMEDRQNIEFVYLVDATKKVSESDEEVTKLEWYPLDSLPPKEELAFDHGDDLEFCKNILKL